MPRKTCRREQDSKGCITCYLSLLRRSMIIPKAMNKIKMLFLLMLLGAPNVRAQVVSANLFEKKWNSFWIATTLKADHEYGVSHFRKTLTLATRPATFIVHVSADNRYKLFVN